MVPTLHTVNKFDKFEYFSNSEWNFTYNNLFYMINLLAELLNFNENYILSSYLINFNSVESRGEEFFKKFTNQEFFF